MSSGQLAILLTLVLAISGIVGYLMSDVLVNGWDIARAWIRRVTR
jgi:hypothetical protein